MSHKTVKHPVPDETFLPKIPILKAETKINFANHKDSCLHISILLISCFSMCIKPTKEPHQQKNICRQGQNLLPTTFQSQALLNNSLRDFGSRQTAR